MKFAHLADCHIGGWSDEKLKQLNLQSFRLAIEVCIREKVDFIIIAGDLFNTALPSIDLVKETVSELKKLNNLKIPVYLIPGSHDFSPSGKTMLDVLEKAGLCTNVFKLSNNKLEITKDSSGVKLTGILGLSAGLDKELYKSIDFSAAESEPGYKIFLLHTTIDEFKPRSMESLQGEPLSSLPKNFNYYAAGHVHYLFDREINKGLLVYPGPTFPNNFRELEDLHHGNMCIVENGNMERIPLKLKDVNSYFFNVNNKSPAQVQEEIISGIKNFKDKIILMRLEGILSHGTLADIDFKRLTKYFEQAYCVLKNTSKVTSKEFQEIAVEQGNVENIENNIIHEHIKENKSLITFNPASLSQQDLFTHFMKVFDDEKQEGERVYDFESRLEKNAIKKLSLEKIWGENAD